MKLFDLHCDTAIRLLSHSQPLHDNDFHISLKKAEALESYAQVMAVFSQKHLSDHAAYERFFKVVENLRGEEIACGGRIKIINDRKQIPALWECGTIPIVLAVEDARMLEGDISRLDILCENGVRILTLNWSGITCIGGAHDTHASLTDFGKQVVKRCFELGIVPDVSHASFEGTDQCIGIAQELGKPVIASHSDSYSVFPHSRNLRDENFRQIVALGGVVGISLCRDHLAAEGTASVADIVRHIDHYLSIGGESALCLGCDLDGTDLPVGFSDISDLHKIEDEMSRLGYSDKTINAITHKNALEFAKNNF